MSGEHHEVLVSDYVAAGWQTSGFGSALKLLDDIAYEEVYKSYRLIPDAWRLTESGALEVIEIEVGHPITLAKLYAYANLDDCMGGERITLYVVDRWGERRTVCLGDWFMRQFGPISRELASRVGVTISEEIQ